MNDTTIVSALLALVRVNAAELSGLYLRYRDRMIGAASMPPPPALPPRSGRGA